jgi:hypothetical protein
MKPKFIICQHLKVYKDMGYRQGEGFVDTGISLAECNAYKDGIPCPNRGRCILAREDDTWNQVSKKSWNTT